MKRILYLIVIIILVVLVFYAGVIFGIRISNSKKTSNEEIIKEEQKIIITSFSVSENDYKEKTAINSYDINYLADEFLPTFKEIINSKVIGDKIKKKYIDANIIELEKNTKSGIIRAIYVCNGYNDEECIEIVKMYMDEFSKAISEIYNLKISIVDSPMISYRIIDKN